MSGLVFLGPTLRVERARELLPNAVFLPPVNGGDILSVLKYRPSFLAVIDGSFGKMPSVWHKEILYALGCGYPVLGASSMGALRAAELCEYGMVGVGRVFEEYRQRHLLSDDEVAVAHGSEEVGYRAMTTSLVDFRFALKSGVDRGLLTQANSERVLDFIRRHHFSQRTWECISTEAPDGASLIDAISILRKISVKQTDAEELLEFLSRGRPESPTHVINCAELLTGPMTALIGRTVSRPVLYSGDWLYRSDLAGRNLRFLPDGYLVASILARVLSLSRGTRAAEGDAVRDTATSAALRMYVDVQVAQCFPSQPRREPNCPFAKHIETAFLKARRILQKYLGEAATACPVAHSSAAMEGMLKNLGRLATPEAPDLQSVLATYDLPLRELKSTLTTMLNIELFVMSYQTFDGHVPDLSVDWWGRAMPSSGSAARLPIW